MKLRLLIPLLLAGCASAPDAPPLEPVSTVPPAPAARAPAPTASAEGYKRDFAAKVAQVNGDAIAESLPEMLKSVVVLNVSVDSRGNLTHVSVRRSNGYRDLENRAMDSVRRAAPFAAPGRTVSFLETFLFRDDGRFQIRSLVN
jgi:periplasmic protein TonB